MVTRLSLAILASSMIPAAAMAAPASEVGYPIGSLAVHSIQNGDYAAAERVLAPVSQSDASDPARLVNIAMVYARTGRLAEARDALAMVSNAPDETLTLSDGRDVSSRTVAATLLRSLDARYAAR
ncbi:tetratricopeptide repeat protein [Sphingobium sp. CR28]|uniref:tetratricopeptide repeat protein n=1 Tax=Sphingobium sp. CR28 TaxID=3400272 RepID=UPI003FED7282